MTDQGWMIDDPEDFWDEDDYDDDLDPYPSWEEPNYQCWTCNDNGAVLGASGRGVNCPHCRPTPRQVRRAHLVQAWWARKWDREIEARVAAGMDRWEAEAPF